MTTDIIWPAKYLPGTTDNYVSNEVIVQGLTAEQVWPLLADITKWESYYSNCADITPPSSGPYLEKDAEFSFGTFGFPPLDSQVKESVAPSSITAGRLAWVAAGPTIDVYHAWIIENLEHNRVRILTQESQIGEPAAELAKDPSFPMLTGHQNWLVSLVKAAKETLAW